jgi:transposase-like protein
MVLFMSRQTSYNEAIKNRLVEHLKNGHSIDDACKLSGCSDTSFYKWYNLSIDGDARYTGFADSIDEAKAEAIDVILEKIKELGAVKEDWHAYAWILERMSKHWNKQEKIEVSGDDEKPIVLVWADQLSKDKNDEVE